MRTLLAAILLAVAIVTAVAIVVPLIARPMIVAAVQAASPFGDQPLAVDVDCNVFGLLGGTVDRVHVRGADLRRGDVTVAALDVTATDVATSGTQFRAVTGTIAAIAIPIGGGKTLTIDELKLGGSSTDTSAVAKLDRSAAVLLVESAFADAGVEVSGVDLGAGTVLFQAFGARVEVPIGVENGSIVVVNPFGTGSFELVTPGRDDPWRFTGAAVTPDGLTIELGVDAERLLAG